MSDEAKCSGGRIEPADFNEGWVKVPFHGDKAHWWVRVPPEPDWPEQDSRGRGALHYFGSLCGLGGITSDLNGLHLAGNWGYCKRCLRLAPTGGSA